MIGLRATSIKTRIETPEDVFYWRRPKGKVVYEQLPLKQGLKPYRFKAFYYFCRQVYEQLPLKQGLKLKKLGTILACLDVYEQLPLKQGLKPTKITKVTVIEAGLRATSIKTRIETMSFWLFRMVVILGLRATSIKTRIETSGSSSFFH